ncbi:MAG: hypothetical protein ACWGO1_08295 [Anaerolineales bacterium]
MKMIVLVVTMLLLAACTVAQPNQPAADDGLQITDQRKQMATHEPFNAASADLPDLGKAPELKNKVWLNTEEPLRLEDLSGKVVLLDMWTFG